MDTLEHRVQLGQAAAEQLTQYLHTLPAEAWRAPSACEGWEVRDVVGHLTFQPGARLRMPIRYGFAVTGAVPSQYTIVVEGDAVRLEPHEMPETHVRCRCDSETFVLLMYGRLPLQSAIASGRLVVEGDPDLIPTFGTWFKFV